MSKRLIMQRTSFAVYLWDGRPSKNPRAMHQPQRHLYSQICKGRPEWGRPSIGSVNDSLHFSLVERELLGPCAGFPRELSLDLPLPHLPNSPQPFPPYHFPPPTTNSPTNQSAQHHVDAQAKARGWGGRGAPGIAQWRERRGRGVSVVMSLLALRALSSSLANVAQHRCGVCDYSC